MPPFPAAATTFSRLIEGVKTDFVSCRYSDRVMVMATQSGSVGSVLLCRQEPNVSGGTDAAGPLSISVLLGPRDEPFALACGKALSQHLRGKGETRPLLLCLGVPNPSQAMAPALMEALRSAF